MTADLDALADQAAIEIQTQQAEAEDGYRARQQPMLELCAMLNVVRALPRNEFGSEWYLAVEAAYGRVEAELARRIVELA